MGSTWILLYMMYIKIDHGRMYNVIEGRITVADSTFLPEKIQNEKIIIRE